jgi:hypothetical protein
MSQLSFSWCWLCSCTEEKQRFSRWRFRGSARNPIRNTLRFPGLRWESETEDSNCRLKRNDLDSERSLLLLSYLPNDITEINFVLSAANKNCTHDLKWDNLFITMATAKHTLMLIETLRSRTATATNIGWLKNTDTFFIQISREGIRFFYSPCTINHWKELNNYNIWII